MPAWPASLPQYLLEQGFSEAEPEVTLETPMEGGKPKIRRRYTTNSKLITGTVAMTQAQRVIFQSFYNDTCRGGSLTFTWVHPLYQTAATFRWRKPVPKWSVRGNAHLVSFAMELIQ